MVVRNKIEKLNKKRMIFFGQLCGCLKLFEVCEKMWLTFPVANNTMPTSNMYYESTNGSLNLIFYHVINILNFEAVREFVANHTCYVNYCGF